jgi:hypothetical protein
MPISCNRRNWRAPEEIRTPDRYAYTAVSAIIVSIARLAEVFRENAFIDLTNISIFGIDDLSASRIRDLSEQHVAFRGRNLPFLL